MKEFSFFGKTFTECVPFLMKIGTLIGLFAGFALLMKKL